MDSGTVAGLGGSAGEMLVGVGFPLQNGVGPATGCTGHSPMLIPSLTHACSVSAIAMHTNAKVVEL
jgi:hypothetical protein